MSQQDQQLINNLIHQQNTSAYAQQMATEVNDHQLSIARVVTAKYKVYVIVLLIVGVVFGIKFFPDAWAGFQNVQSQLSEHQSKLTALDAQIQSTAQYKHLWKIAENVQGQVLHCLNHDQGCGTLDSKITENLKTVVSYLQLGTLHSTKMGIDEKKILKNLDQYLIKNNPGEVTSTRNGEIVAIEIEDAELVDATTQFWRSPLQIKVVFDSKDDLVSFVDNIEKYIIPTPEDRILYKIEQVSYDMMAYQEAQETEIGLFAYYFK